jgi:hypothetical protein
MTPVPTIDHIFLVSTCQKSGDSGNFSITGVGLVKIDDVPDRGEILHETNQSIFTADRKERTSALTFLYW